MGWSCVPREVVNCADMEFYEALKDILTLIINEGHFPEVFNCTRLVVLNKTPNQTPMVTALRPI